MKLQNNDTEKVDDQELVDASNNKDLTAGQLKFLKDVFKSTYDSKFGEIFRIPVDPIRDNVPDYFDVISNPIDLSTIISRMDNNEYVDPNDCIVDFRQMISNCYIYNPEGSVAQHQGKELERMFNKKMLKYPTEIAIIPATKRRNSLTSPQKNEEKRDCAKNKNNKIKKTAQSCNEKSIPNSIHSGRESSRTNKKSLKEISESDKISSYSLAFEFCNDAISELFHKKHSEYSFPFLSPVDPVSLNIPDYYDVVKCPMDLGTVRSKLKANQYTHPQQFTRDVRLVFTNCYRYNASTTEVYVSAEKLHIAFEQFIASCPKEIYHELLVNDEVVSDETVVEVPLVRGTRRSAHIEIRQVMDMFNSIERKIQQMSEDINKMKSDRASKFVGFSENEQVISKKQTSKLITNGSSLKSPFLNPLNRNEPQKIDDIDPLTYDEKLALSSQIMRMPEPKIKEILGIINQKEPWSRRMSHDKNKDIVEIELDSLQPSTLRALEKYVQTMNRKKSEPSYRKKCTAEERLTREQDLRKKLQNMESQLAGKAPIHIGSKSISKISENNKTQDQMTSHLSDTSSGSDISDDDFSKRYSLSTKAPTSNSSAFLTNTPTAHTHNKPLNSYSKPFTAAPIKPPVSSLSTLPSNKINNPKMTSSIPPPLQTSFLTKLGIADSSSSPNTSSKNFASEKLQLEASREEERKIRAANVGTIDMNAQSDMMKIFEEKL